MNKNSLYTSNCNCQRHFDIRCVCHPRSPGFINCPQKIPTAVWYLQNDGVFEEDDVEWKETVEAILEDDTWSRNGEDYKVYSQSDIDEIINIIEEDIKENKELDEDNYKELDNIQEVLSC